METRELMENLESDLEWAEANEMEAPICLADDLRECLRRVSASGWISIKDRLPSTECLAVSIHRGPSYGGYLVGCVMRASYSATGYICNSDIAELCNVTHWKPLPEPPKEGE